MNNINYENPEPAVFAGGYPAGARTKLDCSRVDVILALKV